MITFNNGNNKENLTGVIKSEYSMQIMYYILHEIDPYSGCYKWTPQIEKNVSDIYRAAHYYDIAGFGG
jgi:hypothetical protein